MKRSMGVLVGVLMMLVVASSAKAAVLMEITPVGTYSLQLLGGTWYSQSIQENTAFGSVNAVSLKIGGVCQNQWSTVTVQIRSDNNGIPSNNVLAEGSRTTFSSCPTWTWYTWNLSQSVSFQANVRYWVVVKVVGGNGDSRFNACGNNNCYLNGENKMSTDGGATWSQIWDDMGLRLEGDATPPSPTISSVSASSIAHTSATITWTTDVASTSQVEYGPTTSYGTSTTMDTSTVLSHSVALTGLTAGTTYHYRVRSKDASNNEATSGDYTFHTVAPLSLRLPFRSGESWKVTQGNNSTIQDCTHCSSFDPNLIYAWDFGTANAAGKAVLTPASGKVVEIYKDCPDNGSYCNGGWGNVVIINYGNNKYGKLAHLRTVSVKVGQYVFQGEQVGTCGATGDNYGPHIHYQTQNSPGLNDSSVPSSFVDPNVLSQNPDGIPSENSWYISSNTIPAAAYHLDTTFDTSGNSNNTTANPSCIVAGCLNLNGTSNYLEAPDSTSLSITGVNISIAGWLKTSSSSTQWIVSKYNNGASDASYGLYLSNGYVRFTVSPNGSAGGEVQSTVGVNDGNRRHVVVTYNGTDLTIYIDGAVNTWQSYFITNIFDSPSPLRIGAKNSQAAMEFFSEMLDELVIYDRTLTADEVNNMYYSSKP